MWCTVPVRTLVTGCAGFIGSHLTESLLDDGHDVIGIDCFNNNYGRGQKLRNLERARSWDDFDFVPIDLARGELSNLVESVDVVFHLAAEPGVRPSWGERFESYVRNNVMATQHLLEATKRWPGKRFVYASSSSIYGEAAQLPTAESTIPRPFSPYGMTKLSGEHLCDVYRANYGVQTVVLRYFSVFGPRQRPDMAFTRFCHAAVDNRPLEIYGDGRQTRDFTYVGDIVSATRSAGVTAGIEGSTFNVGGGTAVCLEDVVELLGEISGRDLQVQRTESQRGDVRDTGADITAARAALGYAPRWTVAAGLREQWNWAVATLAPVA
jgi:UDP-glucuronate 4-epimerase